MLAAVGAQEPLLQKRFEAPTLSSTFAPVALCRRRFEAPTQSSTLAAVALCRRRFEAPTQSSSLVAVPPTDAPTTLANDRHSARCLIDHRMRNASQERSLDAGPPVRAHDDEINAVVPGVVAQLIANVPHQYGLAWL